MTRDTVRGGAGISVYFWPASTPLDSMPSAVAAAAGSAPKFVLTDINRTAEDAAKWGLSAAHFTNDGMCDMSQFFGQQEIIINLTFCGDCESSGCAEQLGWWTDSPLTTTLFRGWGNLLHDRQVR